MSTVVCPEPGSQMTIGSVTRPFDTDLTDPQPMLTPGVVGSITLAPDKNAPCHCANCVVLATEVERLRRGNRALLGELTTANDVIRSMETKINMEGGK